MQKTIIAISGGGTTGKSSTVVETINELERRYGVAALPAKTGRGIDRTVIIVQGKLKIGLTSQGDPNTYPEERVRDLIAKGCSIVICTTRTSGATVKAVVKEASDQSFRLLWWSNILDEDRTVNHHLLNGRSARAIADLVESIGGNQL